MYAKHTSPPPPKRIGDTVRYVYNIGPWPVRRQSRVRCRCCRRSRRPPCLRPSPRGSGRSRSWSRFDESKSAVIYGQNLTPVNTYTYKSINVAFWPWRRCLLGVSYLPAMGFVLIARLVNVSRNQFYKIDSWSRFDEYDQISSNLRL
jgi:hypothetical protein